MKKEVRKNFYTYTMFGLLAYFVSQIVGGQNVLLSMHAATLLPKALERLCRAIQNKGIDKAIEALVDKASIGHTSQEPEGIQALFNESFKDSIKAVKSEYDLSTSLHKEDPSSIGSFFSDLEGLIQTFSDELGLDTEKKDILKFLKSTPAYRQEELYNILGISNLLRDFNSDFVSFFKGMFINKFQEIFNQKLCASQEDNPVAWREYQKMQFEGISAILSSLEDDRILTACQLSNLKSSLDKNENDTKALNELLTKQLNNYINSINNISKEIPGITGSLCSIEKRLGVDALVHLQEVSQWISDHYGTPVSYSPSLEEFKGHLIDIPESLKSEVLEQLGEDRDVLVFGKPASGKSTFGLALAWNLISSGTYQCYYIDFKNYAGKRRCSEEFVSIKYEIDFLVTKQNQSQESIKTLILFDNAHTNEELSVAMLQYLFQKRHTQITPELDADNCSESGQTSLRKVRINALGLSRPISKRFTEQTNIWGVKDLHYVMFEATAESYACVARLIHTRLELPFIADEKKIEDWIAQTGNDLVVFNLAYNPNTPDQFNEESKKSIVNEKYLKKADEQVGKVSKFLQLCILNELDIDLRYGSTWNVISWESLFPTFADGRLIEETKYSPAGRCACKLFHASLGKLIREVYQSLYDRKFNHVSTLMDICKNEPDYLGVVLLRLSTYQYWNPEEVRTFRDLVAKDSELVHKSLLENPASFTSIKKMNVKIDWASLVATDESKQRLRTQVADMRADILASFLRHLAPYSEYSDELLREVVSNEDYRSRSIDDPKSGFSVLLNYTSERKLSVEADKLYTDAMARQAFKENLPQMPAFDQEAFFRYLLRTNRNEDFKSFMETFIKDEQYIGRLAQTHFYKVAWLLRMLDKYHQTPYSTKILDSITASPDFGRQMIDKPLDKNMLPFVKYIGERTGLIPEQKQRYLDCIFQYMVVQSMEKNAKNSDPRDAARLLAAGLKHQLLLPQAYVDALKIHAGDFFKLATPHPDYPQAELIRLTATDIIDLLMDVNIDKQTANCIMSSLLDDHDVFDKWWSKQSDPDKELLLDYAKNQKFKFVHKYIYDKMSSILTTNV